MIKVYKSAIHPRHWVAYVPGTGWLLFPNREHGWLERQPARGLDPLHLREVGIELVASTGILEPEPEFADVG